MQVGELRERVTIQQKTSTKDAQGGSSETWATLATVWAHVTPTRMSEQIQAAAIGARHDYRLTVRYRADVTPKMRVSWTPYKATTAKSLEIHGVQPLGGDRAFLVLDCGETA